MHKILNKEGVFADGYLGSFGRYVWDNCCDKIKEMIMIEEVKK